MNKTPPANSTQIKLTAYLFMAAWILMATFLLSALGGYFLYKNKIDTKIMEIITLGTLFSLLVVCALYFFKSLFDRCPNCNNRIFSDNGEMHLGAKKSMLGFPGYIAEQIVKTGQFNCVHCGCNVRLVH